MKFCVCFFATLSFATIGLGQAPESQTNVDAQAIVSAQFGSQFQLLKNFPVLTGDFNSDGSEDAVFAATGRGALQADAGRFKVLDPSSDYFGLGDARITSQFASPYPEGPRYLLIIHGSGKEGWRGKETQARFVLINMEFDRLSVGHIAKKKKVVDDITVEQTGILTAFLYWNGRQYKFQPGAAVM